MAKPAKPAPADAGAAAAKPKSKKLVLIIVGVLVLALAGGGGWFFFLKDKAPAVEQKHKAHVEEPPNFLPLDPFSVNLQREESEQCANAGMNMNIGITLKIPGMELTEKVRQKLPEIRSRLLFMLSSKRASELMPTEGKKKLAKEIIAIVNSILGIHVAPAHSTEHVAHGEAASGVAAEAAPEDEEPAEGVQDALFTAFLIGS
jgi:flagellar FliL protein